MKLFHRDGLDFYSSRKEASYYGKMIHAKDFNNIRYYGVVGTTYCEDMTTSKEKELARKLYKQFIENRYIPPHNTYEADAKIDNVHYVLTIERETDRMISYRAAQW